MYKEKLVAIILIVIILSSIFSGTRGVVFTPIFAAYIYYLINKRSQASIMKTIFFISVGLIFIIYLGILRSGSSFDTIFSAIGLSIFYGNNFSDLRDFAWVLSGWNGEFLYGKSYLAAIIAFIPRSLSNFREAYSIGAYTNSFLGFDTLLHPGLRPGRFGEIYLNFGFLGVLILGIFSGYVMKYTDQQIKDVVNKNKNDYIEMHSRTFLYEITNNLHITAGFWGVYINLLILLTVYIIKKSRIHISSA